MLKKLFSVSNIIASFVNAVIILLILAASVFVSSITYDYIGIDQDTTTLVVFFILMFIVSLFEDLPDE